MSTDSQLDLNVSARLPWRDPILVQRVMAECVASAEPTSAFMSLAASCVPLLADECKLAVVEADDAETLFSVLRPRRESLYAHGGSAIVSLVGVPSSAWGTGYRTTVTFAWKRAMQIDDADEVIASLLIRHVAESVTRERLTTEVERSVDQVANLSDALISNRRIGQAVGIIMANRKVTDQRAFDMLRSVSQHSHRKLRDLADEVCLTGVFDVSPVPQHFPAPLTTVDIPIRTQP